VALHHSFGREADLGWGLGGEGEAELVEARRRW